MAVMCNGAMWLLERATQSWMILTKVCGTTPLTHKQLTEHDKHYNSFTSNCWCCVRMLLLHCLVLASRGKNIGYSFQVANGSGFKPNLNSF